MSAQTPPQIREAWLVTGLKTLLYAACATLYVSQIATNYGIGAALVGVVVAVLLSRYTTGRGLRTLPVILVAGALIGLGFLLGHWTVEAEGGPGVQATIYLSDTIVFFSLACGSVFLLRSLAQKHRALSVFEFVVVVLAVTNALAEHRGNFTRPRVVADWALSLGIDPAIMFLLAGVSVVAIAMLMLLRRQGIFKLATSLVLLFFASMAVYYAVEDKKFPIQKDEWAHKLPGSQPGEDGKGSKGDKSEKDKSGSKDKGGKGGVGGKPEEAKDKGAAGKDGGKGDKKGGEGGGSGDGEGGAAGAPPEIPDPIAVVRFHDDVDSKIPVLYFRQDVLSHFSVNRLVADASGKYDRDVIRTFPRGSPQLASPVQVLENHLKVPTSVYLMVDHPSPLTMGHTRRVVSAPNPNPRHFVTAYKADSYLLDVDFSRLVGRKSLPDDWSQEKAAHYLAMPDDPRYADLAATIVRDLDPRFEADDVMRALVIKRYLEKEGFYTRKQTYAGSIDPTADFLFGSMRGYCVHFAHAAVHLYRSQGIPSRVALGYAVQLQRRPAGSSIYILNNEAHAWPEIFVDGIGWVTFDIYPERSDEPPRPPVDRDLQSMLGELARGDRTAGLGEEPRDPFQFPWLGLLYALLGFVLLTLLCGYSIKAIRAFAPGQLAQYRAALDRLSEVGVARRFGETRESHARRAAVLCPSFASMTQLHMRRAMGGHSAPLGEIRGLRSVMRQELKRSTGKWRRFLAVLNPFGWFFTR